MPSQWVKQRASPRSLHQDALKQIHDAQPVRPQTQAIAIQAVALDASDGLNVAHLATTGARHEVDLQGFNDSVVRGGSVPLDVLARTSTSPCVARRARRVAGSSIIPSLA